MFKPVFNHSDDERFRILKNCKDVLFADIETISEFDESLILRVDKYFDIFDKIRIYDEYLREEKKQKDQEFANLFNKASVFVRHYLQTMSMAIERGELPANTAAFYDLSYPFEIPQINSDAELISLAEKLFDDDLKRTASGGKYFANPSIGAVRVWVEKFTEAIKVKNNVYNVKKAAVENIESIRADADFLLSDLFKILLSKISSESDDESLKILRTCGFNPQITDCDDQDVEDTSNESDKKKNPGQLSFDL
jgi:hypothetical protein